MYLTFANQKIKLMVNLDFTNKKEKEDVISESDESLVLYNDDSSVKLVIDEGYITDLLRVLSINDEIQKDTVLDSEAMKVNYYCTPE